MDTAFFKEWQTLIGAFLGGVFAIGTALIVAYSQRRREDRRAASALIGTFDHYRKYADAAESAVLEETDEASKLGFADVAWELRLETGWELNDSFDTHASVASVADPSIGHPLDMFKYHIRQAHDLFTRSFNLEQQEEQAAAERHAIQGLEQVLNAVEHAKLMSKSLRLILQGGPIALVKRLWRRLRLNVGRAFQGNYLWIYPADMRPSVTSKAWSDRETWYDRLAPELPQEVQDRFISPHGLTPRPGADQDG